MIDENENTERVKFSLKSFLQSSRDSPETTSKLFQELNLHQNQYLKPITSIIKII